MMIVPESLEVDFKTFEAVPNDQGEEDTQDRDRRGMAVLEGRLSWQNGERAVQKSESLDGSVVFDCVNLNGACELPFPIRTLEHRLQEVLDYIHHRRRIRKFLQGLRNGMDRRRMVWMGAADSALVAALGVVLTRPMESVHA
jgi:hypothetical protein